MGDTGGCCLQGICSDRGLRRPRCSAVPRGPAASNRRTQASPHVSDFFEQGRSNRRVPVRLPVSPECPPTCGLVPAQFSTYFQYLSGWHIPPTRTPRGKAKAGGQSKDWGSPAFRVPGQVRSVSRRGPRRQENPRLAGAGSANPGFYAESGNCRSVRERTRPRSNRNMASPFIGPLAMLASILRHPRFPPAPAMAEGPLVQGRGGVPATCRRWGGGEVPRGGTRFRSARLS